MNFRGNRPTVVSIFLCDVPCPSVNQRLSTFLCRDEADQRQGATQVLHQKYSTGNGGPEALTVLLVRPSLLGKLHEHDIAQRFLQTKPST